MDFQRLVKNVQKLKDVDDELCMKLRNYVYPLIGACQEEVRGFCKSTFSSKSVFPVFV